MHLFYVKILFGHLKLYKWPCIPNEVHNAILGLTQTLPSDRSEISTIKTKMGLLLNDEKFKDQGIIIYNFFLDHLLLCFFKYLMPGWIHVKIPYPMSNIFDCVCF